MTLRTLIDRLVELNITEKHLEALKQVDGWVTVSDWAIKVSEVYPDLLVEAEKQAQSQANETTGLRELAARIGAALSRDKYQDNVEIDTSEKPRKVKYVSTTEHKSHVQTELEEDVAPLKRGEIIKRDSGNLTPQEEYRIAEFESISKQLKQFFGLEFEVDHAQALLNGDKPGHHHPDNLQLLLKVHNGKKHNQNWQRFSLEEQINYIMAAINMQKVIAPRFEITCDDSVLDSLISRLKAVY